jgi:hypothetical protein
MMRLLGALVFAGASEHTLKPGKRREPEAKKGDGGEEEEPAKRHTNSPHAFSSRMSPCRTVLSKSPPPPVMSPKNVMFYTT